MNASKREALNESMREWRKKNLLRAREIEKRSREKNRGSRREYKARYAKDKYSNDLNFQVACRVRARIRKALMGSKKNGLTVQLLGCSFLELVEHIEKKFIPGMTIEHWLNGEIHLDHIKPVASFDLTDATQQQKCFHFTNLQPLWAIDNLKKGNLWVSKQP